MIGTFNLYVVALSYLVAVGASYVALNLASQMAAARGRARYYWLLGGGCAMGLGIWSMHFIGMLAFRLPIATSYDVSITIASLMIAVMASTFALYTIDRTRLSLRRLVMSGTLMGIGIAAMHYTGMASMRMFPSISYDPLLAVASVAIAVAASVFALWIASRLRTIVTHRPIGRRIAGALVMGFAIAGMHYTAMRAAHFAPGSFCLAGASEVGNFWLAVTIGLCTVLLLTAILLIRPSSLAPQDAFVTAPRSGIRTKLSASYLIVASLVVGFAVLATSLQLRTADSAALLETSDAANMIVNAIGDDPVRNPLVTQRTIASIHAQVQRDMFIVDTHRRIVADTSPGTIGTTFDGDANNAIGRAMAEGRPFAFIEDMKDPLPERRQLAMPLHAVVSDTASAVVGAIVAEYTPIYAALLSRARTTALLVAAIGASFVFLIAVIGLRVASTIAAPLGALQRAAAALAEGRYETRVDSSAKDEIGALGAAFNRMAEDLSTTHSRLLEHHRDLDDRIVQRTRALQRAEAAQRESADELRLIAEHIPVSLGYIDSDQRLRYHNQRFARMYGFDENSGDGRTVLDILGPAAFESIREYQDRALAGHTTTYERHDERGGSPIDIFTTMVPRLHADGHAIGYYVMSQDISEQKRDEEVLRKTNAELMEMNVELKAAHNQLLQSEKMASIGQLASGVAHEINNPIGYVHSNLGTLDRYLTGIFCVLDCYAELEAATTDSALRERIDAAKLAADLAFVREDVRALLAQSREGISRVAKIVRDLKNFSRSAGDEAWQFADLHAGIDSTLSIVWNEIKYKAGVNKEYGPLPPVECRPSQLNQVFMNLLVNGAQAINGRGTIVIRTGVSGAEVWIEFEDSGTGIPAENLQHIFDPFFTTKPVGKGTGLGLSLAYGIVKDHGGRIAVSSVVGEGTTFRIWLPIAHPLAPSITTATLVTPAEETLVAV